DGATGQKLAIHLLDPCRDGVRADLDSDSQFTHASAGLGGVRALCGLHAVVLDGKGSCRSLVECRDKEKRTRRKGKGKREKGKGKWGRGTGKATSPNLGSSGGSRRAGPLFPAGRERATRAARGRARANGARMRPRTSRRAPPSRANRG